MNNYINNTGYLDNAETSKNSFNIIPSNIITMKGVSRPLTLVPIINGKPLYSKKIIAKPGDPDINFGNDVEGVLELPYAQIGMMTNPMFLNAFNGILNTPNAPQNHPITFDDLTKKSTKTFYPEYDPYTGNKGTPTVVNGIESISNNNPINTTLSDSELKAKIDPNALQKILAEGTKSELDQQEQKGNPFIGAINPYGGWNMNNASVALGAFAGMKIDPNSENVGKQRTAKTLGIIGSAGKILLEGARNAFSGAGAMKVYQEALNEQQRLQAKNYLQSGLRYYQEGGEISNKEGLLSTGNFIYGNDNHPNPNVEVEKGEYIQTPDGSTMEVLGKKHSEGGEMLNLPQSTAVVSDYLKIGSKLATYFKKNYDLNVTSKSTFATVLDRYKRKIGLTKILEEETNILQKITDQEDVEFEPTRDINLQILSKKAVELQSQKQPLEKRLEEFTRVVFDKQELQKGNEVESSYKQEGGDVENVNQDGNQIEQLILMFSKITNQDPKQIIAQLQQLPDDQLQNAIQEISKVVQQAMNEQQGNSPQEEQQEGILSNPQEEQQEQMKMGGGIDEKKWLSEKIAKHIRDGRPKDQAVAIAYRQAEEKFGHKFQDGGQIQQDQVNQLISVYAQLVQQDPNEIIQQLQQLPEDQQQQALQQIIQLVQQSSNPQEQQQMKVGGNIQYMQNAGVTYDENYIPTSIALQDSTYNPVLIPQGISSMDSEPINDKVWNPVSDQSIQWFVDNANTQSKFIKGYTFNEDKFRKDISNAKTREGKLAVLNKYQGDRQQSFWDNKSKDLKGYVASGYAPTQTGAEKLLTTLKGKEREKYVKLLKDSGVTISGNSITGGFYKVRDNYNQDSPLYKFVNNDLIKNTEAYDQYTSGIINDKVYDRRMENFRQLEFPSIKERDAYAIKNNFKVFTNSNGGIEWVDPNNRNNIIRPIVYRDRKVTPEELKQYNDQKLTSDKDGYKPMTNDVNVYERWVTEDTPQTTGDTTSDTPDPKKGLNPWDGKRTNFNNVLPITVPDQSNLPPNYIPTSMREVKHVQANTINISPEATLGELANQAKTASKVLVEANPYTSAAGVANLQANENQAINQAYMQSEMANQQDQRNVENINEQRIQQRDNTNLNLASQYEKEAVVGAANLYDEWRNFITNKNQQNLVNYNLKNQANAYNAMNPNYQIGTLGEIHQTDESPIFYTTINGQKILMDKQGNTYEKKIKTDSNGKTTTEEKTTSKSKKKKGGFITSDNLSNFLKSINK